MTFKRGVQKFEGSRLVKVGSYELAHAGATEGRKDVGLDRSNFDVSYLALVSHAGIRRLVTGV